MDHLGAEPETDPELAGENTSNLIQDGLKTPPEELDEVSEEEEVCVLKPQPQIGKKGWTRGLQIRYVRTAAMLFLVFLLFVQCKQAFTLKSETQNTNRSHKHTPTPTKTHTHTSSLQTK